LSPPVDANRKSNIRRTAIVLAIVAAAFYFGFIVMTVMRSSS
jgi:hypothetical protein